MAYPKLIEDLISRLMRLPGIGRRSAERVVFFLLNDTRSNIQELCQVISQLKEGMRFCRVCNNLSEHELCLICNDSTRDKSMICVVEDPKDVLAIERTGTYHGQYHVLLGSISPADGRGPDDLKIQQLIQRVKTEDVKEVVIATDPDTEGETTALYVTRDLRVTGVKISRIGLGIPVGSALEYADLSTLSMSLASRREIES